MKDWKECLLVIGCIVCLAAVSCQSLVDKITPSDMPEEALGYLGIEPNEIGFPTLYKARKIAKKVVIKHRDNQIGLLRLTEDDKYAFEDARAEIQINILEGEEFQKWIIGGEGQDISLVNLLLGFTGGAAIFNRLKRKEDSSPEEVEIKVARAKEEGIREITGKVGKETLN